MSSRTILLPLDGTVESEAGVSPARMLALALQARLVLLTVPDSARFPEPEKYLTSWATVLRAEGLEVEVVASHGDVVQTILQTAESVDAQLVSMATHGRGGIARLVVGSVAERVVEHSRIPVVLFRPIDRRMEKLQLIVVAVDGRPGSLVALRAAARVAQETRVPLLLLRVVVPLPLWIYDPTLGIDTGPLIDPRWDEGRREHAEAELRPLVELLAESGVEASAEAVPGEVAPTIAQYADEQGADLIVMGTHPHRLPLGNIAEEVARTAKQPVMMVPRGAVLKI